MDSHTISALNQLEVVKTGRRRRWSEGEKPRIVLESLSEPRLVAASAAMRLVRSLLVTWRRAFAANRTKSKVAFVRAVGAESEPVASPAASSRSATAHSTERRIEIELAAARHCRCEHRFRGAWPDHRGFGSAMIPISTGGADLLKVIWHDGPGACLFTKKLERGRLYGHRRG